MRRNLILLLAAVAAFWLAAETLFQGDPGQPAPAPTGGIVPIPQQVEPNRVADISAHSVAELENLFERIEQLVGRPRSNQEAPLISLVLHGPEVEFFALKNYEQYKPIVDRAAKLAALGAVEISICQTRMRKFGIEPDGVPAFLNQVPFGPEEVERLLSEGYVYM